MIWCTLAPMGMTPFHGPPADLPVVPGFELTTLIGLGGHGAVWAAREQISGDVVALKIGRVRPRSGADDGSALGAATGSGAVPDAHLDADTARHEADLLARLDHPHLIRLRRVVTAADGSTVLVLDLAAGGSLATVVAGRGPLTPGEVVTMLVPLASALADLHDQGVVHGDLSPGNVLFSAGGRPMLGDLGASSILGARPGKVWSTPGFSDPARAQADAGAIDAGFSDAGFSDVWGLGALAWFALTAQPPDPDGALPRSTPAELAELIRECLAPDVRRRPLMEDVAVRAWDAADAAAIRLTAGRSARAGSVAEPGAELTDGAEARDGAGFGNGAGFRDGAGFGDWPDPDPLLRLTTVRSVHAPDAPSRSRRRFRPGPTRRHLAGAVLGCVLTGTAAVALFLTSSGSLSGSSPAVPSAGRPTANRAAAPSSAATGARDRSEAANLAAALDQIARARAAAFHQVSVTPLAGADEPGSAAEKMDQDLVRRLRDAGLRLDGVSYRISDVHVVASTATLVDVEALVTTSAHRQVVAGKVTSGRVAVGQAPKVVEIAAEGPQRVRLRLVRAQPDGADVVRWLVRTVSPVATPAPGRAPGGPGPAAATASALASAP